MCVCEKTILLPVHHLPLPFTCDHVQQGLPEMVSDATVADHLISKDDETQIVDVLYIILLNIHAVLWWEEKNRGMMLG